MDKDSKLRSLYLAKILYERTDENHYLKKLEITPSTVGLEQLFSDGKILNFDILTFVPPA